METTEILLKVLLVTAFIHQSEEKCETFSSRVYCSEITLEAGKHLEINNTNRAITDIFIYNCSISSIPSGFFSDFKNAETISMKHVGASVIEPEAFHGMTNLKELGLSGNDIPEIQANMFTDLVSLEELDLPFNNLIEIKPETFKSLTKLKSLDLSFNDIEKINPDSFTSLTSLEHLNLHYNKIKEIKAGTFQSMKNLIDLNIGGSDLYKLGGNLFAGLSNLKYLFLSASSIHQLDADCFAGLSELVHLRLGYNFIQNITHGVFANLQNLQILELNHNELITVAEKEFSTLTKLKSLSINDNEISWLDADILLFHLPNLANISLNNNTWQCGSLQKIIDVFKFQHVEILDNYTKYQTNVYGIACTKENFETLDRGSTENTLQQHNTKIYTINVNKKINDSFPPGYDIRQHLEKFEKEYKNHSVKLTIINAIIMGVALLVIISLLAFLVLYLYRRKKLNIGESFSIRYNDVGLMSDCTE